MAKSTAVATTDTKSSAMAVYDYGADAAIGHGDISGADVSLPFLNVLQGISPEVADNNPEGARAGMFLNSITKELYDGEKSGVVFQPVYFEKKFIEWVPRAQGGGFVGAYDPGAPEVRAAQQHSAAKGLDYGKLETPSGNQLVETLTYYGQILSDDGETAVGFAALSCSSTKIKPAKAFNTVFTTTLKGKVPIIAWRTRLMTVKEKNDQGTYSNIQFKPFGENWTSGFIAPDSPLFAEGKALREMIESGKAKVDHSQAAPASGGGSKGADDEIPF